MSEKVVFLEFRKPTAPGDFVIEHAACVTCKNKTFLMIHDKPDGFPLLRCACCGSDLGRVGWAGEGE